MITKLSKKAKEEIRQADHFCKHNHGNNILLVYQNETYKYYDNLHDFCSDFDLNAQLFKNQFNKMEHLKWIEFQDVHLKKTIARKL